MKGIPNHQCRRHRAIFSCHHEHLIEVNGQRILLDCGCFETPLMRVGKLGRWEVFAPLIQGGLPAKLKEKATGEASRL